MEYGRRILKESHVAYYRTDSEGNEVRNYAVFPTYSSSETIWPYGNVEDMFEWTYRGTNNTNTVTGKNILIYDDGLVFNPNGNPPTVLHPHPHPHFVFNDKVVISTYVDVIGKMQILLTPVDQLIEKVDK